MSVGSTSVSPIHNPKRVATDAKSALIEGRQQMSSDCNILGNQCSQENNDTVTRLMKQTPGAALVNSWGRDEYQVIDKNPVFRKMQMTMGYQ